MILFLLRLPFQVHSVKNKVSVLFCGQFFEAFGGKGIAKEKS